MGVGVGRQLCLQGADGVSTGRGPGRQQGSSLNAPKLCFPSTSRTEVLTPALLVK